MKKKILLIALAVLVIGAIAVYNYTYHDHRDIQSEAAAFTVSASDFSKEFSADQAASVDKYLNKTISVSGAITDVESNAITIDNNVYAMFDTAVSGVSKGDKVQIKARCIGYDELLETVKLDQSSIVK